MEAVDKSFEVELSDQWSKTTVVEGGLKLAPNIEAAALIFPKDMEHLLGTHPRIFGS